MGNGIIEEKSKLFALRIIKMYKYLCNEKKEYVLSKQVLRSGTSIGANIAEAECGMSRKDFLAKMYIAYKETAETMYWIELLYEGEYIDKRQFDSIYDDCSEIKKYCHQLPKTLELMRN